MRAILGIGLTLALATSAEGEDKKDEKIDAKLLVGVWKQVEPAKGRQIGTEFTADGKVHMWDELGDGKRTDLVSGTYKVTGMKVTFEMKDGDVALKIDVLITKLTKDECWQGLRTMFR